MTTLPKEKTTAKKIIYPLNVKRAMIGMDLTEADFSLLRYFRFINQFLKVDKIYCVHVAKDERLVFPVQAIYPETPVGLDKETHSELMKKMEMALVQVFSKEEMDQISYSIESGEPADMLKKIAEDAGASLLFIGKHAENDTRTIRAMNLIRATDANVLMAPEKSIPRLKTILVPIDFSENAVRALKTAVGFKHSSVGPVRVIGMHINQTLNLWSYGTGMVPMEPDTDLVQRHRHAFNQFVEANLPDFFDQVEPLLIESEAPDVSTQILNKAGEVNADLIIMGAKGHSRLYQILLGSTTEMVLRNDDDTPVLVVK